MENEDENLEKFKAKKIKNTIYKYYLLLFNSEISIEKLQKNNCNLYIGKTLVFVYRQRLVTNALNFGDLDRMQKSDN